MSPTIAQSIGGIVVRDLGGFMVLYIPSVMVVFAGLLALGFGIYLIRRYIVGSPYQQWRNQKMPGGGGITNGDFDDWANNR